MTNNSPLKSRALVAVFDILGYSAWMKSLTPLAEKVKMLKLLNQSMLKTLTHRKNRRDLNLHSYADNILLWSGDCSATDADYFFFISSFVLSLFLHVGIPVRGAISYGEVHFSRQDEIYTGPPLVEAHELQAAQDWLGVSLSDSVESIYGAKLKQCRYIVQYKVPQKCGARRRWVLDWPRISTDLPSWARAQLSSRDDIKYLMRRAPKQSQKKYSSTLAFYFSRLKS